MSNHEDSQGAEHEITRFFYRADRPIVRCIGGSTAHALPIVQDESIGQTPTDFTSNALSFNLFNPSLGTLNSVVVAITATGNMSGNLTNTADTPQSFTFTETTDLNVGPFPDSLSTTFAPVLSASQIYTNLAGGGTAAFGPASPLDSSQGATYTATADLMGFTGVGTFGVPVSTMTGETVIGGGGNVLASLNTTAGVDVRITYNYTPIQAPEPASCVLAGLGAVGLAWIMRRRRPA